MTRSPLATYLNDHLAGATGAIEMLQHLLDRIRDPELLARMRDLLPEIEQDRETLRRIMEQVGAGESSAKQAMARMGERLSRVKRDLPWEDNPEDLGRFEELEALGLGILGKRSLWMSLGRMAETDERLREFDFERLRERAEHQHAIVEAESQRLLPGALRETAAARRRD